VEFGKPLVCSQWSLVKTGYAVVFIPPIYLITETLAFIGSGWWTGINSLCLKCQTHYLLSRLP